MGLRLLVRFRNKHFFYRVRLLASRPTPNLEGRVSFFVWVITLDPSGMGSPTSSICYYQHSYRDHMKTQAMPLRQRRDTCGGLLHLVGINPLNPELNPICYLLALLAHHFLHVSRIRVKSSTIRLLMSYIYIERLFLMFLDHTQRRSTVGRTPLDE